MNVGVRPGRESGGLPRGRADGGKVGDGGAKRNCPQPGREHRHSRSAASTRACGGLPEPLPAPCATQPERLSSSRRAGPKDGGAYRVGARPGTTAPGVMERAVDEVVSSHHASVSRGLDGGRRGSWATARCAAHIAKSLSRSMTCTVPHAGERRHRGSAPPAAGRWRPTISSVQHVGEGGRERRRSHRNVRRETLFSLPPTSGARRSFVPFSFGPQPGPRVDLSTDSAEAVRAPPSSREPCGSQAASWPGR